MNKNTNENPGKTLRKNWDIDSELYVLHQDMWYFGNIIDIKKSYNNDIWNDWLTVKYTRYDNKSYIKIESRNSTKLRHKSILPLKIIMMDNYKRISKVFKCDYNILNMNYKHNIHQSWIGITAEESLNDMYGSSVTTIYRISNKHLDEGRYTFTLKNLKNGWNAEIYIFLFRVHYDESNKQKIGKHKINQIPWNFIQLKYKDKYVVKLKKNDKECIEEYFYNTFNISRPKQDEKIRIYTKMFEKGNKKPFKLSDLNRDRHTYFITCYIIKSTGNVTTNKLHNNYYNLVIYYAHKYCNAYIPTDIINMIKDYYYKFQGYDHRLNIFNVNNNIRSICYNNNRLFCITADNKLIDTYISGWTSSDAIYKQQWKSSFGKKVKFISKSRSTNGFNSINSHTFLYTTENELYGYGYNYSKQLGLPTIRGYIDEPRHFIYNFKDELIKIACGSSHTIFLTKNGKLFGCGSNKSGQILQPNPYLIYSLLPMKLSQKIIDIGCTSEHTFILTNSNYLYGLYNLKINLLSKQCITKIKCGYNYIGCITDNFDIYMGGNNDHYQCGYESNHSYTVSSSNPDNYELTQILYEHFAVDINCGWYHTFVLINNGDFYAFGKNNEEQCFYRGYYRYDTCKKPKKVEPRIEIDGDIIDIIPTENSSIIIVIL